MTLNSSVAEESHIVNFDIESMDHNYCMNMTNIFVVDHIPGKAYNLDATQYPHLYNIDVIDNFDGRIDLLIGQDYADCFQPLELNLLCMALTLSMLQVIVLYLILSPHPHSREM